MKSRSEYALSALTIGAGGVCFWFLGWFLWCQFEGWAFIKNTTFQHLLMLLISTWILGSLAVTRPRKEKAIETHKEVVTEPKNNPHPPPNPDPNPQFDSLSKKVDDLLEKQTDVHAIMRFFKSRTQKDNVRKFASKSEIKLEIPPELAEQLKPKKLQVEQEEEA